MAVILYCLHVLYFIMINFYMFSSVVRQALLFYVMGDFPFSMCASSVTRRATGSFPVFVDVTQGVVGLMSVDQVRRVSIDNGIFVVPADVLSRGYPRTALVFGAYRSFLYPSPFSMVVTEYGPAAIDLAVVYRRLGD